MAEKDLEKRIQKIEDTLRTLRRPKSRNGKLALMKS